MLRNDTVYSVVRGSRIRLTSLVACPTILSFVLLAPLLSGCSKAPERNSPEATTETIPEEEATAVEVALVKVPEPEPELEAPLEPTKKKTKKKRPKKGTVAAIRAAEKERDPEEKERIDRLIKKRFSVADQLYSVVTLKDGSTITAKDIKELDDTYTVQTAANESRTVFSTKELKKSEVENVEPESGSATMWLKIQDSRVPSTARDGFYHERMLALVFDYFLDEYSDSEHVSRVNEMRKTWVEEKTKLDDNWMKVEGEWYGPDDTLPTRLSADVRRDIEALRKSLAKADYLKASSFYRRMKIPPEFDKERRAVIAMRSTIEKGLDDQLAESQETAEMERENALKTYEKELAKISTWKPKVNDDRNLLSETKSEYQIRAEETRRVALGKLKMKQASARNVARARFHDAKKQSHLKYSKEKSDVQRAHKLLDRSSL